jgi:subtilisin family serine protease
MVLAICSPANGLTAAAPAAKGPAAVYIVEMAEAPVAAYRGGRAGLAATKPSAGRRLDSTSPAVRRYAAHLDARQSAVLQGAGVAQTSKLYGYQFSFNGFAASLTPGQVARLQRDPAVRRVTQDRLDHTMTDNTPSFLGLDSDPGGLWTQAGGLAQAGEDVVVGVIDTGIWPEHPSFSDQRDLADRPGSTGKRTSAYGPPPAHFHGTCQAGEQWSKDDCNNKLIGARYFLKGFGHFGIIKDDFESPRDADGHGSHTASTAAGNAGVDPSIFGRDLGVGTISGMAPRARIAAYKACWEDGCALSDLVAAIDAAVADGVDVINYSIGSDTPALLGPDEVAFLFAAEANVFVAASAGNAGPGTSTVGSPASAPWVTAVGASTHDRFLAGTVRLGSGVTYRGASVTRGLTSRGLVDGAAAGSIGCEAGALDPAKVSGKIVLCEGSRLRAARGQAVLAAGGVGMVLYNVGPSMMTFSDNHYLPAVHIDHVDGLAIRAYITAQGAGATAAIVEGGAVHDSTAPAMTHFSSRGPNGAAGDVIKPDVTAPGMQILAANTPVALHSAPGQLFQAISGTSMSSPHVAGVAALLVQAHRDWTPGQIRSALMTTGSQDVTKEDRSTPADPFDFGAGHIRPNPANDPGLTYDVEFLDYIAFLCGTGELATAVCTTPLPEGFGVQPIDPSDLNLPSIGIEALAGTQTVTRTVTNTGPAGTYTVVVDAPAGIDVTVTPETLTIGVGEEATYQVQFSSTSGAVVDQYAFGSLTWSDGAGHSVRSPIAIRPVALSAPDEVTGTGTTGDASWEVTFGSTGPFTATPQGLVPATRTADTVVDDPANDITVALETGVGIDEHVLNVPAGTSHLRAALFDADTDGADDLDLYLYDPAGTLVALSGTATSTEQVDVANPEAGNWKLIVHGWQTDGADAAYTLSSWLVPPTAAGNMSVTAPATATVGQQGTIDIAWTGLTAATRYLGMVAYGNGSAEIDRTLVAVTA